MTREKELMVAELERQREECFTRRDEINQTIALLTERIWELKEKPCASQQVS